MASSGKIVTREVGPIVAWVREVLLGRKHMNPLRFRPMLAERPGPEPNLPDGPAHKLADNYYYTRDGRREVTPPSTVADHTQTKALESGEKEVAARPKSKTPGAFYQYGDSPVLTK